MLDVLIQTYNEELNLPHTLESVAGWVNHVYIVDSGSTDRTAEIAESYGATLVHHDWEGYARQKNWALANMDFQSPWTLILDADEAVSPELKKELLALTSQPVNEVQEAGFLINRIFVFMGRRIRHCGYFPSWNLRLFKRGMARYEDRSVHEHMICDGPVGRLKHLLIHEDRRGLEHFFAKHNRYSTLEAREMYLNPEPWPGWSMFFTDTVRRRRFLKSRVLPRVPLSWAWRFVYMYVLRLGFLDGQPGLKLSTMISAYEMLIQGKYKELLRLDGRAPQVAGLAVREGVLPPASPAPESIDARATSTLVPRDVSQRGSDGDDPVPATPTYREVRGPKLVAVAPERRLETQDRSEGVTVYTGARGSTDEGERHKPFGGDRTGKARVSVVIPTLNEEPNLARCLDHLQWADEVVIIDSGSQDATVDIARRYGAKVIDFRWNGAWPKKKNWALRHAELSNEWVLIVDADEWIMPELAEEISDAIKRGDKVGYYVNRRFIFMGRWIKHCGYYPSWNLRLIKRGFGEYEQLTEVGNTGSGDNEVHEHVVADGGTAYLKNDMLHFAFPNVHTFMEKHNRYSNWEAAVQHRHAETTSAAIGVELSRRRRLKNISRRLPFRSTLRFLYAYVWKLGFLDGRPGYVFSRLLAIYEYLSVAKYIELRRAEEDHRRARTLSPVPQAMVGRVAATVSRDGVNCSDSAGAGAAAECSLSGS